eukprot:4127628-Karenia_brevis.AAC.1
MPHKRSYHAAGEWTPMQIARWKGDQYYRTSAGPQKRHIAVDAVDAPALKVIARAKARQRKIDGTDMQLPHSLHHAASRALAL